MIQISSLPILALFSAEEIAPPVVGFLVVMMALAAIWILLEIQGAVFRRLDGRIAQQEQELEEEEAMAALAQGDLHGGLSPELVAIITAAVHTVVDAPARIVSIRSSRDSSWSEEGRRSIYSSHRLR